MDDITRRAILEAKRNFKPVKLADVLKARIKLTRPTGKTESGKTISFKGKTKEGKLVPICPNCWKHWEHALNFTLLNEEEYRRLRRLETMEFNLDGKSPRKEYEKIFLDELKDGVPQVYNGEIIGISDIYEQKKFKKEEMVKKITMTVKMTDGKEIPFFLSWVITKGSGTYSNSKMYDVVVTAGLLEKVSEINNVEDERQLEWFKDRLVGKNCKFLPKTISKDDKKNRYSCVDKFTFIGDGEKVEEEQVGEEESSSSHPSKEQEEIREKKADAEQQFKDGFLTKKGFDVLMKNLDELETKLMRS